MNKNNLGENIVENQKIKDKNYLKELQRFFDLVDNVKNEKLEKRIIYQMLKCNEIITNIYEKEIHCNKTKIFGKTTKK